MSLYDRIFLHESDEEGRRLERSAASGDPEATERLYQHRRRAGGPPEGKDWLESMWKLHWEHGGGDYSQEPWAGKANLPSYVHYHTSSFLKPENARAFASAAKELHPDAIVNGPYAATFFGHQVKTALRHRPDKVDKGLMASDWDEEGRLKRRS